MPAGELVKVDEIEDIDTERPLKSCNQEPTENKAFFVTQDPKLNYYFGGAGVDKDIEYKERVGTDKLDYNIVKQEEAVIDLREDTQPIMDDRVDKRNSLSYMSVTSVGEGEEWYRQNFPKVPDDLYGLMARWSFGDLSEVTKKSVKNKKKKDLKKNKKPEGLQVEKGNFVVTF